MQFTFLFHHSATGLAVHPAVTLVSGDTVTIQVVPSMKLHVGCYTGRCGAQSCPGMYFEQQDYRRCVGEVFQIYRAAGPGQVKTGDKVGFYFPYKRKWLRAAGGQQTDLIGCPGVPANSRHRLNTRCSGEVFQIYRAAGPGQVKVGDKVGFYFPYKRKWIGRGGDLAPCPGVPANSRHRLNTRCWGEVFQLYARGKSTGQPIDQLDHVMIYYPQGKNFYMYRHDNARNDGFVRSSCPGQCLPPQPSAYERCYRYVFAIRKKL